MIRPMTTQRLADIEVIIEANKHRLPIYIIFILRELVETVKNKQTT